MKKTLILSIVILLVLISVKIYAQNTTAKRAPSKPAANTTQKTIVTPVRKTTPASSASAIKPSKPTNPPAKAPAKVSTTTPTKPVTTTVQTQNKPTPTQAPQPAPVRQAPQYSSSAVRVRSGYSYAKGDKLLNVGVGLSSYYYGNPIGISFESGIDKDISLGAQLDYNSSNYYGYSGGYTAYYLGARGSFHFNRILNIRQKKIDLYAGVGLGYQRFRWNDRSYGYSYNYGYRSGLFFNYFIGGKYYFTDKIGAFVELGYTGLASSRVGVTFKFK